MVSDVLGNLLVFQHRMGDLLDNPALDVFYMLMDEGALFDSVSEGIAIVQVPNGAVVLQCASGLYRCDSVACFVLSGRHC